MARQDLQQPDIQPYFADHILVPIGVGSNLRLFPHFTLLQAMVAALERSNRFILADTPQYGEGWFHLHCQHNTTGIPAFNWPKSFRANFQAARQHTNYHAQFRAAYLQPLPPQAIIHRKGTANLAARFC